MDDAEAVRATRLALRRVYDHLVQAHERLGAQRESLGLVDVVFHPQNPIPALNVVQPRRGTAWIPAPQIEQGLARLRELTRVPRLQYIEGLFPAQFGESLAAAGLIEIQRAPLLIATPSAVPAAPSAIVARAVSAVRGYALWIYAGAGAHYALHADGVEPLDLSHPSANRPVPHVDGVVYRRGLPVRLGRLTFHDRTAHIAGLAALRSTEDDRPLDLLLRLLADAATKRGCTLIFAAASDAAQQAAFVRCGFSEAGAVVSYAPAD